MTDIERARAKREAKKRPWLRSDGFYGIDRSVGYPEWSAVVDESTVEFAAAVEAEIDRILAGYREKWSRHWFGS
jgi:hypothetical protein